MFDPTKYNFDLFSYSGINEQYSIIWVTNPMPDGSLIGKYEIEYDSESDWWNITEVVDVNDLYKSISLYSGKIPNDKFGFELLVNMELLLPVVQREIKINEIL